ncbi:NAD-dependent histone deacetylase sir2 [Cladophialophora chaetospira]|uniref:NAD-dependent histone deacetylase sir2 n=1 Tax=Cladophialophora chaetospira TaxID=386627 RepID=A0AA38X4K8_9EURO|nr:NAD-dependent histone deacetylase sir2 [Cladophialophora chaetospira]
MASSAPQSPAHRDGNSYFDPSPDRPSPSKLLRIHQLFMDRANSLPPRRLSSPANKPPQIRPRLNQYHTLDHAVSLFKSSKNIIVLTGAGISTSLGVPDFRSANGVYQLLEDSPYDDPQEVFHIDNFKTDPQEFFKQAAKVFPTMQGLVPTDGGAVPVVPKFSLTHAFIAMLQAKDKLLTNYTQNIDSLEVAAGVSSSKLIQCHGTLATASCMSCGKRVSARKYMPVVQANNVPYCKCSQDDGGPKPKHNRSRGRSGKKKRKRDEYEDTDSDDTSSKADFPKGLIKPDMTFFGEGIAESYAPRLKLDKAKVDLLVIVGTSMQVAPVNDMQLKIPPTVPQIWISKDRCQREGVKVDIELRGECDLVFEEIARRAGWEDALSEQLWTSEKAFDNKALTMKPPDPLRRKSLGQSSTLPVKPGRPAAPGKSNSSTSPVKPAQSAASEQNNVSNSPAKPERPLQIRQKSNEFPDSTVKKSAAEIIIKVNDKEITLLAMADAEPKAKTKALEAETQDTSELNPSDPSMSQSLNGSKDRDENNASKKRAKSPSPSKVTIELEVGTTNRWFIRRAK